MIQDITHRPHKSALFSTLDVFLPPKGLHQCLNYPWFSSLPLLLFPLEEVRASAGKDCTSSMCCKVQFSSCGSTNRGWSLRYNLAVQSSADCFSDIILLQFLHVLFIIFLTCYVVTLLPCEQ